jgi:hypothetical protein
MAKNKKQPSQPAPRPEKKSSSLGILALIAVLLAIGVFAFTRDKEEPVPATQQNQADLPQTAPPVSSHAPDSSSSAAPADNFRIPPYFESAALAGDLKPTLDPAAVEIYAREGYEVARRKPQLIAQMPCFCYCDRFGHKSLHTCFETDHAVNCDICLKEAIEADRMDSEGMSPKEIRDVIIEQYRRTSGDHTGHSHS